MSNENVNLEKCLPNNAEIKYEYSGHEWDYDVNVENKHLLGRTIENMCRACLNQHTEMELLFASENKVRSLLDMFISCTSLKVSENDPYPKHICKDCVAELSKAFEFRNKCYNSIKEFDKIAADPVNFADVKIEDEEFVYESDTRTAVDNSPEFETSSTPIRRSTRKPIGIFKSKNISKANNRYKTNTQLEDNLDKCLKLFTCVICNETFKRKTHLTNHTKTKHKKTKTCHKCNKNFKTNLEYKEHIEIHKRFTCPEGCGYECNTSSSLLAHKASHSDELPYECKICHKRFKSSSYLIEHTRGHSGQERYTCEHCGEKFVKRHQKQHHIMWRHTSVKSHLCQICGKAYRQSAKLVIHMRQHTGEKPFKCSVCPMAFAVSSTRDRHMLTHTGEKKYPCTDCDKRFATPSNLKQHMVRHTGERKHVCDMCGKAYTHAQVLRNHLCVPKI